MTIRMNKFLMKFKFLYRNISFILETTHSRMKLKGFLFLTFLLLITGILAGTFVFESMKGVFILGIIFTAAPIIYLRIKLMGQQMKTRINFLPAIEVFYQYYVLSDHGNLRMILKKSLEEKRMMYPMKSIFEQLYRNLTTHRETEDCLRIFRLSLGHIWADYFIQIFRVGWVEGIDISSNLKALIGDMRKAQRADQVEKNRLLEIRVANFSSIFFLIVFVGINFRVNYHNAYYYYLIDTAGRNMLLDAFLLIFASFVMGIYLSIKRM